uniref:Uncharacterized protein n=1 Tax=Magallana gigas TaxID=29159 RepID=K1Q4Z5_MAGGI
MATGEGAEVHVSTAVVNWTRKTCWKKPFLPAPFIFLSLKFPPLLRPSRSEVFDEADIKGIFTYLLFKTAQDTNFYFYGQGCEATSSE